MKKIYVDLVPFQNNSSIIKTYESSEYDRLLNIDNLLISVKINVSDVNFSKLDVNTKLSVIMDVKSSSSVIAIDLTSIAKSKTIDFFAFCVNLGSLINSIYDLIEAAPKSNESKLSPTLSTSFSSSSVFNSNSVYANLKLNSSSSIGLAALPIFFSIQFDFQTSKIKLIIADVCTSGVICSLESMHMQFTYDMHFPHEFDPDGKMETDYSFDFMELRVKTINEMALAMIYDEYGDMLLNFVSFKLRYLTNTAGTGNHPAFTLNNILLDINFPKFYICLISLSHIFKLWNILKPPHTIKTVKDEQEKLITGKLSIFSLKIDLPGLSNLHCDSEEIGISITNKGSFEFGFLSIELVTPVKSECLEQILLLDDFTLRISKQGKEQIIDLDAEKLTLTNVTAKYWNFCSDFNA